MLINLNFQFKDLSGADIPGNTAAKFVAETLAGRTQGISPIKAFEFAQKLFKDGSIEVDTVDSDAIEKIINDADVPNLVKAQICHSFRSSRNGTAA